MASSPRERVTVSLAPDAIAYLDRVKKRRRVSRSRALELLIEERQREEKRRAFAAEAREFFANENPADRADADAFQKAALADWTGRED